MTTKNHQMLIFIFTITYVVYASVERTEPQPKTIMSDTLENRKDEEREIVVGWFFLRWDIE